MFTQHGRAAVTMANFALAVGITQLAIKQLVGDLDHLFGQVLVKHLDTLLDAVNLMPRPNPAGGAPQTPWAARRAAYFYASRGFCNVPTPLHFLLIRERFMLPEDELEGVEIQRRMLASMLGGEDGDAIMALLDCPTITLEQVEAMVAGLQNWHAQPQPCATPEPAPEPGYRPAPPPREPDPAARERVKMLLDKRLQPLPILLGDTVPNTDPWAEFSDDELQACIDAGLPFPAAPPAPRTWVPTIVQVEDEEDEDTPRAAPASAHALNPHADGHTVVLDSSRAAAYLCARWQVRPQGGKACFLTPGLFRAWRGQAKPSGLKTVAHSHAVPTGRPNTG